MALNSNMPYTNLHDLNLDWIIQVIKDIKDGKEPTIPDNPSELFASGMPYTNLHELNLDWIIQTIKDIVNDKEPTVPSTLFGVAGANMPYTNLHELNLDWLIAKVKELEEEVEALDIKPATELPLMDGTATVGTSAKYSREDHIHPTDTSRASADDVIALTTRVTTAENNIDNLETSKASESELTALSGRVTTAEETITTHTEEINSAKSRLDVDEANITTLFNNKQKKLQAGTNITITEGSDYDTISASGTVAIDWANVSNQPQINNHALASGNNTLATLGIASASDLTTLSGNVTTLSGRVDTAEQDIVDLMADKQDVLVSGTNIKTVNSTSLLGSGNVAVQPTLVSGTNIKTINSTSLLGSGDVAVQPTLVSGTNIKTINSTSLLGSGNISITSITLADVYPVGSIYMSVVSTSPATLFGGTWEQLKDMFLLGAGDTYSAGSTGGEATHTLTIDEMPAHTHSYSHSASSGSNGFAWQNGSPWTPYASGSSGSSGGGQAHNNMPPYLTVYMWKRTA